MTDKRKHPDLWKRVHSHDGQVNRGKEFALSPNPFYGEPCGRCGAARFCEHRTENDWEPPKFEFVIDSRANRP